MKAIIVGDGKVGHNLAENLSREGNDVTIIDKNPEALKKTDESLEVLCIKGNGAMASTLAEADVKNADLLIAATTSDEVNMVCCLTAKRLGAKYTVARIRNPEYANEITMLKKDLRLNLVLNPEYTIAEEIARTLRYPSAMNTEYFANQKVEMLELKVNRDMPVVGLSLRKIAENMSKELLIGAVIRDDKVIIPSGDFVIQDMDIVYIIGHPTDMMQYIKFIGLSIEKKVRKVMMAGGGKISYYLAKLLCDAGMKVKIIEIDKERCIELSESLSNTLIIHGDAADEELLKSENINNMDVFISLTDKDEENLMTALLARQNNVEKVIVKISRSNYVGIIQKMGLDTVISPKQIITKHILKYVRGLQNACGSKIESVYRIIDGKAEIIEFVASESSKILNIPLKKLNICKDIIVAAIARDNQIIIPHGEDVIKPNDNVIVISKDKNISDLDDIIKSGGLIKNELQNSFKKLGNIVNM